MCGAGCVLSLHTTCVVLRSVRLVGVKVLVCFRVNTRQTLVA